MGICYLLCINSNPSKQVEDTANAADDATKRKRTRTKPPPKVEPGTPGVDDVGPVNTGRYERSNVVTVLLCPTRTVLLRQIYQ